MDENYFRPMDVESLLGDYSKAKKNLGWNPKTKFTELVRIMMEADLEKTKMLLEGTLKSNEKCRRYII